MRIKPFEELQFTDDYMFKKVLEHQDICKELIECLLHVEVEHLEYPELEKEISPYYTSKGVRLDVYVKDSKRVFDIEIQTYRHDALGKRVRYYQSMIDCDAIMKGAGYNELKESYILLICTDFPFLSSDFLDNCLEKSARDNFLGQKASESVDIEAIKKEFSSPVYTFRNICLEDNRINLGDNTVKVIYNASEYEKETDEKVRAFLKFIKDQEPADDFSDRIKAIVENIKKIEANKTEYMAMNVRETDKFLEGKAEGRIEGKEEGRLERTLEDAILVVKKYKVSPKQVSIDLKIPLPQLQEALKQAKVQ